MSAGRYRQRVTIQAPVADFNRHGEPIIGDGAWNTFGALARMPAEVIDVDGTEGEQGKGTEAIANLQVTMPFVIGINPTMRVIFHDVGGDRVVNIVAVRSSVDGTSREIIILGAEKAA